MRIRQSFREGSSPRRGNRSNLLRGLSADVGLFVAAALGPVVSLDKDKWPTQEVV